MLDRQSRHNKLCLQAAKEIDRRMKKRNLVEKIAREGCEHVNCYDCPFVGHDGFCSLPGDTAVAFAVQWLSEHEKKDKHCPHCGGSGEEFTPVTTPGGSTAFTKRPCPLCLGSKKRIKRADLEAEVVRLRGEECK